MEIQCPLSQSRLSSHTQLPDSPSPLIFFGGFNNQGVDTTTLSFPPPQTFNLSSCLLSGISNLSCLSVPTLQPQLSILLALLFKPLLKYIYIAFLIHKVVQLSLLFNSRTLSPQNETPYPLAVTPQHPSSSPMKTNYLLCD